MESIGIVAGSGKLPLIAVEILQKEGLEILYLNVSQKEPGIKDELSNYIDINPGALGKAIKVLRKHRVKDVVFAGKVEKYRLFKNIKPDLRAMKLLAKMKLKSDRDIMEVLVEELEKEGISVLNQTEVFKRYIATEGVISGPEPRSDIKSDIESGYEISKKIANIGLGQTVVIKGGIITATESIEGTDETIRRGAKYGGEGFTVVKVASDDQNPMYDLPAVGPDTLKIISSEGGSCLAVEVGFTILLDLKKMKKIADENKICLFGI